MNLKNVATVKKKASSTKLVTNLNHYHQKLVEDQNSKKTYAMPYLQSPPPQKKPLYHSHTVQTNT